MSFRWWVIVSLFLWLFFIHCFNSLWFSSISFYLIFQPFHNERRCIQWFTSWLFVFEWIYFIIFILFRLTLYLVSGDKEKWNWKLFISWRSGLIDVSSVTSFNWLNWNDWFNCKWKTKRKLSLVNKIFIICLSKKKWIENRQKGQRKKIPFTENYNFF